MIKNHTPAPYVAWLLFAIVIFGWGTSFLGIQAAIQGFTVLGLVTVRNLLAAIGAAAIAWTLREPWPDRDELPLVLGQGLLLVLGGNIFSAASQRFLSTGVAGLLNSGISLWVVALSRRFEPVSKRTWLGVVIGLFGVALLLLPGEKLRVHPVGVLCMLASTFTFSLGAVIQRRHPPKGGTFSVMSVQMLLTTAITACIAVPSGGFTVGPLTLKVWSSLLFLVIFSSLLAYAAFAGLSKMWPPSRFGTYSVITPIVAVALGAIALKEPLTLKMLTAMAITLFGVAMVQRRSLRAGSV
ncbi:MAG: EamA family transporter [Holophagales bacterium]|nr:EamA family transporter [Holophagales bacterium]